METIKGRCQRVYEAGANHYVFDCPAAGILNRMILVPSGTPLFGVKAMAESSIAHVNVNRVASGLPRLELVWR